MFAFAFALLCAQLSYAFVLTSASPIRLRPCLKRDLPEPKGVHHSRAFQCRNQHLGYAINLTKKSTADVDVVVKHMHGQSSKVKPQELLATYGFAYLTTSISFAIVSYSLCFLLVSRGVDVAAILGRVGIHPTPAAASAGTAAIAYAMHKAASPIRFPPTVLLTPVVAGWMGGKKLQNGIVDASS